MRFLLGLLLVLMLPAAPAAATEAGWALLRNGGQVVLMRYANAPGTGDPANFDVENCRTQRNLSERGRQQARRIGALFAARAAPVGQVYSSRFCRCLQTAELAFGASLVEPMEALDSLEVFPEMAEEWTKQVIALTHDYTGSGNIVLVTHQSNVEALTGVRPREGEAVIIAPNQDGVQAIGRVVFN